MSVDFTRWSGSRPEKSYALPPRGVLVDKDDPCHRAIENRAWFAPSLSSPEHRDPLGLFRHSVPCPKHKSIYRPDAFHEAGRRNASIALPVRIEVRSFS